MARNTEIVNGVKVNNNPKLSDGTPAMFVRVNTKAEVTKSLDMLQELNPDAPALINKGLVSIYAPDGDLVYAVMPQDETKKLYICRFHKEVFKQ